ncbi:hypothetical protein PQX77_011426 [Marasmius sp. AFHP31]|nr:hypothetical protein PQX77_011426 [Marasmius sp. AFHP31]
MTHNKHAPPRIIFVWVRSKRVRATLIHQQTHDLSDMCTFHVTPTDFDSPSYYVMNLTAALKDIPREVMRSIARFAIAQTLVDDDKFRALIREATSTDPRPTNAKVCEAVMGIDVQFYEDPGNPDNTSELSVFFAPVTNDYQKSQEIKEHIRICHPRFKHKAHVFHLSWDHHKGNTGSLFCPLCLLDDHPTPRCPFPYIRDWQGPGIDHTLTNALNDKGTNVNALWDEAYILAIPQGLPIPPDDGYESDEKVALNNRHPWYYTPSATVQNRIANRYSASSTGMAPRGGPNRGLNRSRTPKTRTQASPNSSFGRGTGRGRGRGGYSRGGRGRGRGFGRGA